jgi:glycerate kinase
LDAELRPGAAVVLDALGVDERIRAAQLVVVGEGCVDEQSFQGKVVGELVARARAAGVPMHAVAGCTTLSAPLPLPLSVASTLAEIEAAARELGVTAAGG